MSKSMLEKLMDHYETMKKVYRGDSVGGHVIGFYIELGDNIRGSYEFPEGKFTIRDLSVDGFVYWNYDPYNKKEKKS